MNSHPFFIKTSLVAPHRKLLKLFTVLIVILNLSLMNPNNLGAIDMSRLIDVTKKIIKVGVVIGLDAAGTVLVGQPAWGFLKKISSPVIDELKIHYPALSFDTPGDENAIKAAEEAAEDLSNNRKLQDMLLENFNQLHKGQQDILDGIDDLNLKLSHIGGDITKIIQILSKYETQKQGQLPLFIDLSDQVNEWITFFIIHRDSAGTKKPSAVRYMVVSSIIIGNYFNPIVLEDGKSFSIYKTSFNVDGVTCKVTMTPFGYYYDDQGRHCRKYSSSSQFIFPDYPLESPKHSTATFCRIDGRWLPF